LVCLLPHFMTQSLSGLVLDENVITYYESSMSM
jgi:hypothetical protein